MKVLITGSNGQLEQSIKDVVSSNHHTTTKFHFVTKNELDITKKDEILEVFNNYKFDYCINCAAYTNVNQAEKTPKIAFKVNAEGIKNLAEACLTTNTILIHISTDYVFDGCKKTPYLETDDTNPINQYGASKLKGEEYIQDILKQYIIIRTSWLYSEYGSNFMKTMIKLSKSEEAIEVINSQFGTPTYTKDLAKAIFKIIKTSNPMFGIYHFANSGVTNWYDYAKAIFKNKNIKTNVLPVNFHKTQSNLRRPEYSVLNTTKIKDTFGVETPFWKDSLKIALANLNEQ